MNEHSIVEIQAPGTENRRRLADLLLAQAAARTTTHSLSKGQQALWFLHQATPLSSAYTILFAMRIRSVLDRKALQASLQDIVNRHPQLRATFHMRDGVLAQDICGYLAMDLPVTDLAGRGEDEIQASVRQAAARPFDLATGPLFRPELFAIAPDDAIFLLSVHHIVFDGWSLWLVLDELRQIYAARAGGTVPTLASVQGNYLDHIAQQDALLASELGQKQLAYWQERLGGVCLG